MGKAINSMYMHTLNGKPAFFYKKEGLLFYAQDGQASMNLSSDSPLFVTSLEKIRKQQAIDEESMKRFGAKPDDKGIRGYLRVRIK